GICEFTVINNKTLIGWNRREAMIEVWDITNRSFIHREKIGGVFVKYLRFDHSKNTLFYSKSTKIESLELDVEKLRKSRKSVDDSDSCPMYVKYPKLFQYCVNILLIDKTQVAKAIEECSSQKFIAPTDPLPQQIDVILEYCSEKNSEKSQDVKKSEKRKSFSTKTFSWRNRARTEFIVNPS